MSFQSHLDRVSRLVWTGKKNNNNNYNKFQVINQINDKTSATYCNNYKCMFYFKDEIVW